ncbi:hypothetical protein LSCM1_06039 [Leishmania martiniquensis]|uniref:Uncharacterized protein n=1 Tax=Leishmania martiniquensis TaxID=1580590 RepID=A0A836H6R9_9TRYP|nr:hypothetical protein LSCM1_06039 [Leishmania martiniquensis]
MLRAASSCARHLCLPLSRWHHARWSRVLAAAQLPCPPPSAKKRVSSWYTLSTAKCPGRCLRSAGTAQKGPRRRGGVRRQSAREMPCDSCSMWLCPLSSTMGETLR